MILLSNLAGAESAVFFLALQLAATGTKSIRIQLRLGSALPGSIFMRRRLGCPAACCAWVRRRRFTCLLNLLKHRELIRDLLEPINWFAILGTVRGEKA
jgi:hypothetical protein